MAERNRKRKSARVSDEDQSLRERAYDYIQGRILGDDLPAGSAISEVSLAREIGASRTPVREAIGQLVSAGLLERLPGGGTVVTRPQRNDIVELYDLREALEVHAVGKAARQGVSPADLVLLHRLCDQIRVLAGELKSSARERLTADQMQRFVAADMGFHTLLLAAAGNRRIVRIVAESRLLVRIFSYKREGHDARLLDEIHRYHSNILAAVERGDAATAMERISEHIRVSLRERLETNERWERQKELNRITALPDSVLEELERAGFRVEGKRR